MQTDYPSISATEKEIQSILTLKAELEWLFEKSGASLSCPAVGRCYRLTLACGEGLGERLSIDVDLGRFDKSAIRSGGVEASTGHQLGLPDPLRAGAKLGA